MLLTQAELDANALDPETLRLAVQQVRVNGFVVFEGVLPSDVVDELHEDFMRLFRDYTAATDDNRGTNRYQTHLPFAAPFNAPQVITSPFALPVIKALLGDDCVCQYFASDTPMPGSEYQAVHSDIHRLFPGMPVAPPTFAVVLNVPLVDFREDNGPVEIWPGGTHLMPEDANMHELAESMDSKPCIMPRGSLLIRDIRMWHRGTPNRSDAPRPNMAMIHARHWLRTSYPPIGIPQETYDGLSEDGRRLFRLEDIGGTVDRFP
ncbi:hypothetical protein HN371_25640 [Candidatus Poribacteria bacterium]|jgi:hypothetical protein|nr:hypothetical protein [Candidatus Poribacteria bacterium]MBT5532042.1 hypothetical protein [Candidatus Poribacteria bacterium]MBT5713855.1 hypothetical protein [Candidatus Poribacteria bacterium]MBT7806416.1 hypothetical protein [Candidatus Poribacteria bacterium]